MRFGVSENGKNTDGDVDHDDLKASQSRLSKATRNLSAAARTSIVLWDGTGAGEGDSSVAHPEQSKSMAVRTIFMSRPAKVVGQRLTPELSRAAARHWRWSNHSRPAPRPRSGLGLSELLGASPTWSVQPHAELCYQAADTKSDDCGRRHKGKFMSCFFAFGADIAEEVYACKRSAHYREPQCA